MDNEDKVERQSAGKKEWKKKKETKYTKDRTMWAQKSGELHPHPPPTRHNKHKRCTVLHLSEDGLSVLHIEWNKTSWRSIFSAKHTRFFFFFLSFFQNLCWVALCAIAVANTARSGWELEGWKKDVNSRSAPLRSCVEFHEGRRCTKMIVIQVYPKIKSQSLLTQLLNIFSNQFGSHERSETWSPHLSVK